MSCGGTCQRIVSLVGHAARERSIRPNSIVTSVSCSGLPLGTLLRNTLPGSG